MRCKSGTLASVGALLALAYCMTLLGGCARLQERREWGACTGLGAVAGAAAGAASGIVIVAHTHGEGNSNVDSRAYAGVGGAAIGALLGGLAGHFLCDPIAPPPPPPPQRVAQAPPPPAPTPMPTPVPKEKLVLRGVHFDFNKSNIRPEDEPVLDEAAETLKAHPNVTVYVDGYCDAVGSDQYNQALSERRAEAVAEYLEGKGIPSSRLIPRGFGKTHFVASNDTDEGRAQNRRVELVPTS